MHILIKKIGTVIKERRKFLKITQRNLAEISQVSLRSLIQVEGGKSNITVNQLAKIMDTLGLTIEIKIK
jgi:transcriptional regulator with XRE-family HTH domain